MSTDSVPSPMPNDDSPAPPDRSLPPIDHARYALWRFEQWCADQGSYRDIDEKVARGDLTPPPEIWPPENLAAMRAAYARLRAAEEGSVYERE